MKPHPYFDGGLVEMSNCGSKFAFFSTRNNNFSNRDQTGSLQISAGATPDCQFDEATADDPFGVGNLASITSVTSMAVGVGNEATGPCQEPSEGEANNNGPQSRIPSDGAPDVLDVRLAFHLKLPRLLQC